MTTKKIVKEFTYSRFPNGTPGLVNRTLDVWPSFLNTYGVWPNFGNGIETHTLIFYWTVVNGGQYRFEGTCDNSFAWSLTDANVTNSAGGFSYPSSVVPSGGTYAVLSGNSWQTIWSTVPKVFTDPRATNLGVPAEFSSGQRVKMTIRVTNDGGAAAFAGRITHVDSGTIEWTSRDSITDTSTGRYVNTDFPFNCTMNVHAWGAGGGHGGTDNQSGGDGANGSYNTESIAIAKGDTVEVIVGTGGTVGIGGIVPPIGRGGSSRINIDSDSTKSFSGGNGGQGILAGSGGAGGGASVVMVNGVVRFVAGGGGGGGGAGIAWPIGGGNFSVPNWEGIITRHDPWSDANPNDRASGASTDYRGANGQNGSFGGGGGGGGGGLPGGTGGRYLGGDTTAYPGQSGGNYPANSFSDGKNTQYYKKGFARGGGYDGAGQSGENGRVVLELVPTSLISVKDSGDWKPVTTAYTKVSGTWKEVNTVYVKKDGTWRKVEGSGLDAADIAINPNTNDYGRVARSYGS
jgi:hypothetical protein